MPVIHSESLAARSSNGETSGWKPESGSRTTDALGNRVIADVTFRRRWLPDPMSLVELYDRSLIQRRDRAAIEYDRCDGETASLTFGEIDARSNRLAQLLKSRGLSRGDRLGFYLGHRNEIIDLWVAARTRGGAPSRYPTRKKKESSPPLGSRA